MRVNMSSGKFSLEGKTALIAGQSAFWAKYLAAALAEAGAKIAIATPDVKSYAEAEQVVRKFGTKAVTIEADLTSMQQVQEMFDRAAAHLDHIDILVNANDMWFAKPLIEISESEWRKVIDSNLTSCFLCCQAVGKSMLKRKKGRIINLASCLAERGVANASAYCSAMGGILQFTRAASQEWARSGITVNAIGLGWFSEQGEAGATREDRLVRYIPMKRYGRPEEVGSLAVYLASDAADFVTGQILYVDGAVTLHM
jgi:NAD(P)-dependent dehydrogenase (short-subunit alcohol dehydrogenase family)